MQRIIVLITILCLIFTNNITAQPCRTDDATGCFCEDGSSTCDLLPDITVAKDLLMSEHFNPEEIGVKYVSVSTPNIGDGPLRVIPTDWFVCGTDTFFSPATASFYCPNGEEAKQLVKQRIYQKQGDEMFYYDRNAGTMTYHPTHNHMHVDEWGYYTIREEVPGADPLTWPIVGEGRKLGFCLMDFGSCETFYGHCRDTENNVLTDNLPNTGLGGGMYTCGTSFQGISVGWTDIYYHNLPDMFVNIPEDVCNGNYMVVVHIDPLNNFLEKDEENNVVVVPVTLSKQSPSGKTAIQIEGSTVLCEGSSVTLTARFGTNFNWSNGETTQSIIVDTPGDYVCNIVTDCGIVVSRTISITESGVAKPEVEIIELCQSENVTIQADENVSYWYNDSVGTNLIGTGSTYTASTLDSFQSYWVQHEIDVPGNTYFNSPEIGDFQYSAINSVEYNGKLLFDVYTPLKIKSFVVNADTAGIRDFEIRNIDGDLVQAKSVYVEAGESRVNVDFDLLEVGENYSMGCLTHPGLYRNNIGVFFPYDLPDLLSIHGSNFGDSFYFYFYNWEVELIDRTCLSDFSEVQVLVDEADVEVDIVDLPVKITTTETLTLTGSPAGGVFSGSGVAFNTFNPTLVDVGLHDITYTYTTDDNCEVSITKSILVYTIKYNFVNYNLGTITP